MRVRRGRGKVEVDNVAVTRSGTRLRTNSIAVARRAAVAEEGMEVSAVTEATVSIVAIVATEATAREDGRRRSDTEDHLVHLKVGTIEGGTRAGCSHLCYIISRAVVPLNPPRLV